MPRSIETYFKIEKGIVIYPDIEAFRTAIKVLPDGTYINKIEKLFGKRTNKQNRYYWGVMLPIVLKGLQDLGHEAEEVEEVHEIVKKLFLKPKKKRKRLVNKSTGEYMYVMQERSTKKLSTVEFNAYTEKIIIWGADFLNVEIPYPNEFFENETA
jgi:hypothetical protein